MPIGLAIQTTVQFYCMTSEGLLPFKQSACIMQNSILALGDRGL